MLSFSELNDKVLIIGAGMVGLSIANQLVDRKISSNIVLIEKEDLLGLHSSGRNSGVLHAGIYYKPGSLKAKVCISGAKRLKKWIVQRGLPISNCGKLIVPQKKS
ncbi:FAD-dependent oxidoreductase [Prochlorococcus sp. MIT 1223]|uniref:FAD-dependent oxidoreductase n=1 Tax=Prochlorococcus sp. MIT 1223 TaxID=3096217 RepID=UPI002A7488B9|nr:FAD-dependent oxidoreductase [Prochlorococcus sp. MIT 1223]